MAPTLAYVRRVSSEKVRPPSEERTILAPGSAAYSRPRRSIVTVVGDPPALPRSCHVAPPSSLTRTAPPASIRKSAPSRDQARWAGPRQHVALAPAVAGVRGDEHPVVRRDDDVVGLGGVDVGVQRDAGRRALAKRSAAVPADEQARLLRRLPDDDPAAHVERMQVGLSEQRDGRPGRAAVLRGDEAQVLRERGARRRMPGGNAASRAR